MQKESGSAASYVKNVNINLNTNGLLSQNKQGMDQSQAMNASTHWEGNPMKTCILKYCKLHVPPLVGRSMAPWLGAAWYVARLVLRTSMECISRWGDMPPPRMGAAITLNIYLQIFYVEIKMFAAILHNRNKCTCN